MGIILAHSSYKGEFIEAIIEDVSPFCLNHPGVKGIDDAIVSIQSVEDNYPTVIERLFNDPTGKLRTIVTFRSDMVQELMLRDRLTLVPALQTILTNILIRTKTFSYANETTGMDWKEALKIRFDEAVHHGVAPGIGSNLEHLLATGLNLNSSHSNRNAVASLSHTQPNWETDSKTF